MLTAYTPGAPLLARTFSHASTMRRLSISNDFTFGLGPSISSSPFGLASSDLGLPGPWAPPALPGFITPTGRSAPVPRGTQPLTVGRRSRVSLSRPGGQHHPFRLADSAETTGSPVPCQRLRRAHAISTPGTARATHRPSPG